MPYDLARLGLFVLGVAFVHIVTTAHYHLLHLLFMTLATWLAYIVYGAPPTENPWHTATAAFYLVLLIQWDPPLWKNSNQSEALSCSLSTLERLSLACSRSALPSAPDRLAIVQTRSIVGLTIVLHILRLYDRGWQPQRWPVPTILGASVGWIAGQWIGLILEAAAGGTWQSPSDTKGKR